MTQFLFKYNEGSHLQERVVSKENLRGLRAYFVKNKINPLVYYPIALNHHYRLDEKKLSLFLESLLYSLQAGIPLMEALNDLALSAPKLTKIVRMIQGDLISGHTFSTSLSKFLIKPDHVLNSILLIGEQNGQLPKALSLLHGYIIWKKSHHKRMKESFTYPFFLMLTLLGFIVIFFEYLIPSLKPFIVETAPNLGIATKSLFLVQGFYEKYIFHFFLASIALVGAFYLYGHKNKPFKEKIVFSLPLFGPLAYYLQLYVFSNKMEFLLRGYCSIREAISILAKTTKSPTFSTLFTHTADNLFKGTSLSETLEKSPFIPKPAIYVLKAAESSNQMERGFSSLSSFFLKKVEDRLSAIRTLCPILILVLAGGMLCWIVLGIFYPVYTFEFS